VVFIINIAESDFRYTQAALCSRLSRKLAPHQRREAIARRNTGNETQTDIALGYNVGHSMISRL